VLLTCEPGCELRTSFAALTLAKYCAQPARIRSSRRKDPWLGMREIWEGKIERLRIGCMSADYAFQDSEKCCKRRIL